MRLSINLATRNRPELLIRTIGRTIANIREPGTVLMVSVDDDDHGTIEALSHVKHDRLIVSVGPREDSLGEKYNRVVSERPADVYLAMVDYAPHVTPGFDSRIMDAASIFPDRIGVVYNHMANLSFPQINAVTHRLAELMGGIYPKWFPYWFVDHWLDDVARIIDRVAFADVLIDTDHRPGTMERREPAFWASLFDALSLERRALAHSIIRSDEFQEPAWRKKLLLSHHPMVEERTLMVNQQCRAVRDAGDPVDERYERIRTAGLAKMMQVMKDLEAVA